MVRPVVMEPLRQQWDEVELELRRILVTPEGKEPTAAQQKKAEQEIAQFLTQLRLEWFGLLIHREDAGITYWQYAELQQTA
jgi:hypothetical protein